MDKYSGCQSLSRINGSGSRGQDDRNYVIGFRTTLQRQMATITNSTTTSLTLDIGHDETLTQGDFVVIENEPFVAQISHTETAGGSYRAEATFVGSYPDMPIPEGRSANLAPAKRVRDALGLPTDGTYLGEMPGLGSPVYLPPDALMEKQLGIFGRTGSGKSYTAAVLIEELLNADKPVLIIDPHGEYTSLKVSADGSPSEFPVTHYADPQWVPEADEELEIESMDAMEYIQPGQATIIDLHGVGEERNQIVAELLEDAFLARKREQIPGVKVIVEEAHNFATSRKSEPRSVIRNIAKEGRKFQFTLGVVSQRPSGIDHEVRAQLQSTALHKLTDDTDVDKAIDSTEGIDRSWTAQIQQLGTGTCILTGDLIASPTFVDVRERETLHHSSEDGPFSATDHVSDPEAVSERQSELESYVEEATLEELREHVVQLTERQNIDSEALANGAIEDQENGSSNEELEQLQSEISEKEERITELEQALDRRSNRIAELETRLQETTSSEGQTGHPQESTSQQNPSAEVSTSGSATTNRAEEQSNQERGSSEDDGTSSHQPDSPRSRETILNNDYVKEVINSISEEIDDLHRVERRLLRYYAKKGVAAPDTALRMTSGFSASHSPEELVESLRSNGFVTRNGANEYEYILDERVTNRVADVLHEDEIQIVIDEIEENI